MVDLARWLGQQLDEDERIARRASEYAEAEWRLDEDGETILWWPPEPRVAEKEREHGLPVVSDQWRGQTIGSGGERIAPHIAVWDPARVLREIDAKRELLARYERAMENRRAHPGDLASAGALLALHGAVKLLALPYVDRPGYAEAIASVK